MNFLIGSDILVVDSIDAKCRMNTNKSHGIFIVFVSFFQVFFGFFRLQINKINLVLMHLFRWQQCSYEFYLRK